MPSLIDTHFEAWLRRQPLPRDWIARNMPAVRAAYDANPMKDLELQGSPGGRVRDRYEEL